MRAGYAGLDIRKTADDVLVAHHDARAGRGGPLVAELGYRELCARPGAGPGGGAAGAVTQVTARPVPSQ